MKKVFLGGTSDDSKWRDDLIPMLKIEYFDATSYNYYNPTQEECLQRESCDFILFVVTRVYNTFTMAEVFDCSLKKPEKTIFCVINETLSNGKLSLSPESLKVFDAIGKAIKDNGSKYFKSLEEVACFLNSN